MTAVFETARFSHSRTSPRLCLQELTAFPQAPSLGLATEWLQIGSLIPYDHSRNEHTLLPRPELHVDLELRRLAGFCRRLGQTSCPELENRPQPLNLLQSQIKGRERILFRQVQHLRLSPELDVHTAERRLLNRHARLPQIAISSRSTSRRTRMSEIRPYHCVVTIDECPSICCKAAKLRRP